MKVNLTGEVQQQLGGGRVRCVALGDTDGLIRGMPASIPARPSRVPVGKARWAGSSTCSANRSTAAAPSRPKTTGPSTAMPRRSRPVDEHRDFRDRHQGDRPADALRPRRQGRVVRRRRAGQDGDPQELIARIARPTAASPCSPASASGPAKATTCGWKCSTPRSAPRAARDRSDLHGLRPDERAARARLRVALSALTMAEYFRD